MYNIYSCICFIFQCQCWQLCLCECSFNVIPSCLFHYVPVAAVHWYGTPARISLRCKSPSFLAAFHGARPLLLCPTRSSESRASSVKLTVRLNNKNGCAKRFIFFVFVSHHHGHFYVDFKCSYTLDYIATLSRSPVYVLHSLAVCAIQCKVVLFVFELVC